MHTLPPPLAAAANDSLYTRRHPHCRPPACLPALQGDLMVIGFTFGTMAVGAVLHPLLQVGLGWWYGGASGGLCTRAPVTGRPSGGGSARISEAGSCTHAPCAVRSCQTDRHPPLPWLSAAPSRRRPRGGGAGCTLRERPSWSSRWELMGA